VSLFYACCTRAKHGTHKCQLADTIEHLTTQSSCKSPWLTRNPLHSKQMGSTRFGYGCTISGPCHSAQGLSRYRSSTLTHHMTCSGGMARQMSKAFLGKQVDGIWHTGVVVHGQEFFFGGGIQSLPPETVTASFGISPVQVCSSLCARRCGCLPHHMLHCRTLFLAIRMWI